MTKFFRATMALILLMGLVVLPANPSRADTGPSHEGNAMSGFNLAAGPGGRVGIREIAFAVKIDATYTVLGETKTDLVVAAVAPDSDTTASDFYDIPNPPTPPEAPWIDTWFLIGATKLLRDARPMADPATWALKIKPNSDAMADPHSVTLAFTTNGFTYSEVSYNPVPPTVAWLLLVDGATIVNLWASTSYTYSQGDGTIRSMTLYAKENAAPTVSLTSHTGGGFHSAIQTITANASDADSVSPYNDTVEVSFYYRPTGADPWTLIGTDNTTPYSISWNTALVADGTTYRARAVAKDSKGATAESISASDFTVDNTPPAAPALLSPADNTYTNVVSHTFSWATVADISGVTYHIQVDDSGTGYPTPEVNVTMIVPTSHFQGSFPEGDYNWRVRATDGAGLIGAWSVNFMLHIDTTPPPAVSLLSPATGAYLNTTTPTFTWGAVFDPSPPVTYNLYIDDTPDLLTPELTKTNLFGTSYTPTSLEALAEGLWYWGVKAKDNAGNIGPLSQVGIKEIRAFTVDVTAPTAPTLLSPANGAQLTVFTIPLDWSNVADATGVQYKLRVDDDPAFGSPLINTSGLASSDYTISSGLSPLVTYYWTAAGVDGAGNEGPWAAAFNFRIVKVTQTATWQAGWVMFGLDVTPDPASFSAQLGDDIPGALYVFHYYPTLGIYQIVSTGAIASGYWIKLSSTTSIDIEGFPVSTATSYALAIRNGWNMIANPFKQEVNWGSVLVEYLGQTKTVAQAQAAGWMSQYIYSYDTGAGIYLIGDPTTGKLKPLVGYWAKSNVDAKLHIPPP